MRGLIVKMQTAHRNAITLSILSLQWILVLLATLVTSIAGALEPSSTHDLYRLGPNDVVRIQVFGEEELTVERKVDGDGKIDYPLLGAIPGEGKTLEELQQYLAARLSDGYLRHPKVSVTMIRHRNFYVAGEVKTPGGFPYEVGVTIQKAIAMAGGFTDKSDKAGINVKRVRGKNSETVSLGPDSLVMPDDLIYVPQTQKFYVNGEVKMPGSYSYEKGLTVHKAITMAGGFTDKAAKSSTRVMRIINGKEDAIEMTLDALIMPEDIIVVPQRFF